jgi:replicative DNA helicase
MSLGRRLKKLETPLGAPRDLVRRREERERKRQRSRDLEERSRQEFETIAAEHPERVPDYLEALENLPPLLEDLAEDASRVEVRDATDEYFEIRQRFEQGYVSGICCEDCGRAGVHYAQDAPHERTCEHCGGITSWYGYWLKNVISLEKLEAEIMATRRLGYEEKAAELVALMERRLMVNETKGSE